MINLGTIRPGKTLRIPFSTFDKDDGSSITMTNYAVADILIYKDGSTTERASTAGFTATTDFDSKTGKHLIIIDLADNTTSGFFAAGSEYLVAIDAVTVDAVTTGGWVARFEIGYPGAILDTTIATLSTQTSFTLTAGPAEDDALNDHWAIIHDVASAVQWSRVLISDYTGSTKTVTLAAGATFTAAAGDNISVMHMAPMQAATLGRKPVVDTNGLVDANTVKLGPSGTGTAQTARDIGASVLLSSGTGTGQVKLSSGYVAPNWGDVGNPTTTVTLSNTTISAVSGAVGSVTGAVGSVTGTAAIATAIWQDSTAGDFTTASSIGKCLYINNVAPGGSGGLFISGSNSGTTTFGALTVTGATTLTGAVSATNASNDVRGVKLASTGLAAVTTWTVDITGSLSGSVGSVTGAVGSVTGNVGGNVTGSVGSVVGTAAIATAIWQDTTAGDFTVASSIGKSLYTSGVVPGASGGLFIAGSNAATTVNITGSLSGSVGSVTGAVGSVTGNVGGNVVGSVASVTDTGAIATAIWQDTTAGDFTVASSIGKSLYTSGVVPGASGGLFIAGSNAATTVNITGSLSGSVGSVTGAVGSVTGAVGSVTAAVTISAGSVDLIWDEDIVAAHTTADTAGKKLADAGSAADPWDTALPGAYASGKAGYILGTNLDAILSARTLASAAYFDPATDTVANVTTVGSVTGAVGSVTGSVGSVVGITASNVGDTLAVVMQLKYVTIAASGNVVTGTSATQFTTDISFITDAFEDALIGFASGTLAGQYRPILSMNSGTGVITVSEGFTEAPQTGDDIYIKISHVHPISEIQAGLATPTNITAGTLTSVGSVTGNVGGNVIGSVGSVTGAVGSVTGNVGGNVTGSVGSVVGNVGGNVVGTVASVVTKTGYSLASTGLDLVTTWTVDLTGSMSGSVGSVTGAVGSVTGNVGGNVNGNVVGSTASVTGAVGSVTGNVGGNLAGSVLGNVSGSVGSVTGSVGSVTGSVGSVTGSVGGSVASVTGAVGSVAGSVSGDVAGKVLGGGVSTITGDGVRAASVTGAVGSVTGSVGSVVGFTASNIATIMAVTNKIDTGLVLDGAVYQFTANMLELAPAGGGGSAPTAAEVADAVWDELLSGHAVSGSAGAALTTAAGVGAGSGARTVTITVNDGATALQNAIVRLVEGVNAYRVTTNASGVAVFNLDDATYTVSITKSGYTYSGASLVVSATVNQTYSMTAIAITPGTGDFTTGFLVAYDETGELEPGALIYCELTKAPTSDTGFSYDSSIRTLTAAASTALVEIPGLVKGATYRIWRGTRNSTPTANNLFLIPAAAGSTYELPTHIGRE